MLIGCSRFLSELLASDIGPISGVDLRGHEDLLIKQLRRGDDTAFEKLVREYGGRLLAVARRLLGNEKDARDAIQDAFLSAFRGIDSYDGKAKLSTWLHRIVVNAALKKMRRRRCRPEKSIEDLLPQFGKSGEWLSAPPTFGLSADELAKRPESREIVRRCIDQLPLSDRTVILLRDIEKLDTEETAAALKITQNAVKIRLHRARQALATLLQHQFGAARIPPTPPGAHRF